MCGICFWSGILLSPDQIPDCQRCLADNNNLDFEIKKSSGNKRGKEIQLKLSCCKECLQYEWNHQKRLMMAKEAQLSFQYLSETRIVDKY
jgi:hypothetical protein